MVTDIRQLPPETPTPDMLIKASRGVYAAVYGTDDTFYVPITKRAAYGLLSDGKGQLGVILNVAGDAFIVRRL